MLCVAAVLTVVGVLAAANTVSSGPAPEARAADAVPLAEAIAAAVGPFVPIEVAAESIAPSGPIALIAVTLAGLVVFAVTGLAVGRTVAEEIGLGLRIRVIATGRFGFSGLAQTAGALALMPAAVALIGLPVPLLAAWALSSGLGGVGGASVAVIGCGSGFVAGFAALLTAGAAPLVCPAAACDGPDVFDAAQRPLAYVASRPLYAAFLSVIALLLGAVTLGVAWTLWTGVAIGVRTLATTTDAGDGPAHAIASASVFASVVAAGYSLSYLHTASTVIYLTLRQDIDGQTPRSLWDPAHGASVVAGSAPADALKSSLRASRSTSTNPAETGRSEPAGTG